MADPNGGAWVRLPYATAGRNSLWDRQAVGLLYSTLLAPATG